MTTAFLSSLKRGSASMMSLLLLWAAPGHAGSPESVPEAVIEAPDPYPDMRDRLEDLGITVAQDHDSVSISRNGAVIWSQQSWMLGVEGPRDYTRNDWPNLLVSTARGRSFRGIALLELTEAGVTVIWSVDGHVSEMQPFEAELGRVMADGGSLEAIASHSAPHGMEFELPFPRHD